MLKLVKQFLLDAIATMALLRAALWFTIVTPQGFGKAEQLREENEMGQVFVFRQHLLPVNRVGVDKQRVVLFVDDVEKETFVLPTDAENFEFRAGPAGAKVKLVLDYLDAAGNDSDNAVSEFEIVDTIRPDGPGYDRFGAVEQIAEEDDTPVATPPAETPPKTPPVETPPEEPPAP